MFSKEYLDNTSVLKILYELKCKGLPTSDDDMELLFKKFSQAQYSGDYPVSWEHLCTFLPDVEMNWGKEHYLELHRIFDLQGDMEIAIAASNMKDVDKAFLAFVYELKV